ncbi:MAG: membrane protein insertase YidC [Bacteroidetes bacterium]|nr:membrane protein insertase YidC [Bacteroidota bacterium]MBM3424982.1 membrane protein insertase YidC [Bacteroidota bacterium]
MDKNTTIGLILIGIVLTVFTVMNQPSAEDIQRAKEAQIKTNKEEQKTTDNNSEATQNQKIEKVQQNNEPSPRASKIPNAPIKTLHLENEYLKVGITTEGAQVASVHLKKYRAYDHFAKNENRPLCLFDKGNGENFLTIPGVTSTKHLIFTTNQTKNTLELKSALDDKRQIVISYSLTENYRLRYSVHLEGFSKDQVDEAQMKWYLNFRRSERKLSEQRKIATICYLQKEDGMDYLSETSDDYTEVEQPIKWVAFKQSYFSSILEADKPFERKNGKLKVNTYKEGSKMLYSHIKEMKMSLSPPFDSKNTASFTWFFGPNEYNLLGSYKSGYDDILNYGWGLFRWINLYAVQPIFEALVRNGIGAGIAILLLTIILKLILMPIQWKMFVSSVKMRILKPQVDKINEKFSKPDQAMEKQTAMMNMYRESGASPLSGCVPMLIQMPILLAVFRFFPANFDLRQQSFLWAEDLSSYDSILDFGFNLWPYGDHISLFTLLMSGTTLIYTYMNSGNMQQPTQPGMPDMRIIMYVFPILMIFIFNDFSSGLSYFYFISTLITILLMLAIKRFFVDEDKLRVKMEERSAKAKASPQKKSRFQERLEEMQRKAKEAQRNSKRK